MTEPSIPGIASNYVTERDNFAKRYRGPKTGTFGENLSPGGPFAFSALIDGHAQRFAAALPPMTLAQWEGVSELASSYLAHLRMVITQGN